MEGACLLFLVLGSQIVMYLPKPETKKLLLADTLLLLPKFTTRSRVLFIVPLPHLSQSSAALTFSDIAELRFVELQTVATCLPWMQLCSFLALSTCTQKWEALRPGGIQMLNFNPFESIQTHFMAQNTACLDACFQVPLKRMCVLLCLGSVLCTCQWFLLGGESCLSSSILTLLFLSTHYINYWSAYWNLSIPKLWLWVYFPFQFYQLWIYMFWNSIIRSIPI